MSILKEGFPYIIVTSVLTIISYFLNSIISPVPWIFFLIITLFVIYFFRNPKRHITKNAVHILSPADGTVMSIEKINEENFFKSEAIKVSIFLSVFNVHANKAPIDGVVKYTSYRPGKYLPAFKPHASELNERNTIGIEGNGIKVIVHQITGLIARRIVCWVKENDPVIQGENYGLIKFGSCTEIIVPKNIDIQVKPGQKVKGGMTIIGVIKNES